MNLRSATAFASTFEGIKNCKLIGLYFSSSWCPDCTPITPKLKQLYESPENHDANGDKILEILYISSDKNEDQMMNSYKETHGSWAYIPFEESMRNEYKRMFGVCAGCETRELGITYGKKKGGIPTLILQHGTTEEILSYNGVQDVLDGTLLQKYEL